MAVSTGVHPDRETRPGNVLCRHFPWIESSAGTVFVLSAGVLAFAFQRLTLLQQFTVTGLVFVSFAILCRRGLLSWFGPVMHYDLVRTTRRSRFFLLRLLYACALAALVYWGYAQWLKNAVSPPVYYWRYGVLQLPWSPQRMIMAKFAEEFFNFFMLVQFLAVLVLTPIFAASAVAEEKERKTLEFLLVTDLRSREVVFGKLASRFASLALIVLTGLPILGLMQFFGGIDPDLVLAGYATTALTVASLASVGVLTSVYMQKSRDAILLTYVWCVAYLGVGAVAHELASPRAPAIPVRPVIGVIVSPSGVPRPLYAPGWTPTPATSSFSEMCVGYLNAGNLPVALSELRAAWTAGTPLSSLIPGLLKRYVVFHLAVSLVCMAWALARFRAVGLMQVSLYRRGVRVRRRPPPRIGSLPMVWKELYIEPGFRLSRTGKVVVAMMVMVSFMPAIFFFLATPLWSGHQPPLYGWRFYRLEDALLRWTGMTRGYVNDANEWVRVAGTSVACVMLIAVAVRAATSISGERDRETLDALLASPLQSHDILMAKWLGSLLCVRWAWLWLGGIWLIGLLTGGLGPAGLLLTLTAWFVYASGLAGIGVWFSTACSTSLRATAYTLTIGAGIGFGHWGLWLCCLPLGPLGGGWSIAEMQLALTPPMVLYWLSAVGREVQTSAWEMRMLLASFGLFVWAFVSVIVWSVTRRRFRQLTARMPYRRPERSQSADFLATNLYAARRHSPRGI
jgi:ABC-type transport system involved in multi-copper enzyme maturation permease subunit